MKNAIFATFAILAMSQPSYARRGENDGVGRQDDGRTIVCTEKTSNTVVLQFMSTQLQGQVSTPDFDLLVKSRGDDVGEINLRDKRSGDSIRAKALEEFVKITLTTDEGTAPTIAEGTTHRGAGELQVTDTATGDKASLKSLSRRGQSFIEVSLVTDENPAKPLIISCEKAR